MATPESELIETGASETPPDATTLEREVSVEQTDCPTCGNKLNSITNQDGSTSPEACSTCYPAAETASQDQSAVLGQRRDIGTRRKDQS